MKKLLVLMIVVLGGCAGNRLAWYAKDDGTEPTQRDKAECYQEVTQFFIGPTVEECLIKRGYKKHLVDSDQSQPNQ